MISKERLDELSALFWDETNEPETQEWLDDLTQEEAVLVEQWDERSAAGMYNLYKDILDREEQRKSGTA